MRTTQPLYQNQFNLNCTGKEELSPYVKAQQNYLSHTVQRINRSVFRSSKLLWSNRIKRKIKAQQQETGAHCLSLCFCVRCLLLFHWTFLEVSIVSSVYVNIFLDRRGQWKEQNKTVERSPRTYSLQKSSLTSLLLSALLGDHSGKSKHHRNVIVVFPLIDYRPGSRTVYMPLLQCCLTLPPL